MNIDKAWIQLGLVVTGLIMLAMQGCSNQPLYISPDCGIYFSGSYEEDKEVTSLNLHCEPQVIDTIPPIKESE
jgi:hypothetical protein